MIQSFTACFCPIAPIPDRPLCWDLSKCQLWPLSLVLGIHCTDQAAKWGQNFPWSVQAVAEEPTCPCLHCRCLEILSEGAARASHDLQPVWGVDTSCQVSMLEIALQEVMLHISGKFDSSQVNSKETAKLTQLFIISLTGISCNKFF